MPILPRIKRFLATRFDVRFYERALFFPLYRGPFASIQASKCFSIREELWKCLFESNDLSTKKILYLEFGVWKGASIKKMLTFNDNIESRFIGFDTFEGLPENWVQAAPAGHFNVGGQTPHIDDPRCAFVKGLFQDTLNNTLDELDLDGFDTVVVHYDQDLYSATCYCLHELRHRFGDYYFIFDEFHIDEGRALYNFDQTYPTETSFTGYVSDGAGYCIQVAGHLTHKA